MFAAPNHTNTPNIFFDEIMKTLKHGELMILLVLFRQTFGWHKHRDRISISQFEKKTGLKKNSVINSVKSLVQKKLIIKHKIGNPGREECWYSLVVETPPNDPEMDENGSDSNNSYRYPKDTGGGIQKRPTKETLTKESKKKIIKEKNSPSAQTSRSFATPSATSKKITFNEFKRSFENITQEDISAWKAKFPAVNIQQEIDRCAEWALTTKRMNYRRSLLTWFTNVTKNHTTPYAPTNEEKVEVPQEAVESNRLLSIKWEEAFKKLQRGGGYAIQAAPSKLSFIMPSNQGYEVLYNHTTEEFRKKCYPAMKRMKLI